MESVFRVGCLVHTQSWLCRAVAAEEAERVAELAALEQARQQTASAEAAAKQEQALLHQQASHLQTCSICLYILLLVRLAEVIDARGRNIHLFTVVSCYHGCSCE